VPGRSTLQQVRCRPEPASVLEFAGGPSPEGCLTQTFLASAEEYRADRCVRIAFVDLFVEFVKEFLIPGSAWFLILAATVCGLLLFGSNRKRAVGRTLLIGTVILYWVMSVPAVARGLQTVQRGRVSDAAHVLPPDPLPIVVLGNGLGGYSALGGRIDLPLGQTAMNTLFALDRFHSQPASMLIASGGVQADGGYSEGAVIRDALIRNHVPADHIIIEDSSGTTREQAIASAKIVKQLGASTCVVVTSSQQMGRAIDLFAREGIRGLPLRAGSLQWSIGDAEPWWHWLIPSTVARAVSRDVIYELMAWPYYRMRGWVS
jgi:uncharacterized SAM-binding protein YcdF (DUF218 family)